MDRTADVLHIGFVVRPEWDPLVPLHWSNIHVETITSRQFGQLPGWAGIADRISDIVRQELGLTHLIQFREKLNQVSPRNGYLVDAETRAAMLGNLTLTAEPNEVQPIAALPILPLSSLPSTSQLPATLAEGVGRHPRATYVRVTSFSQQVEEADTAARAGVREAWVGNTPPSRNPPLRLPAPEHLGLSLVSPLTTVPSPSHPHAPETPRPSTRASATSSTHALATPSTIVSSTRSRASATLPTTAASPRRRARTPTSATATSSRTPLPRPQIEAASPPTSHHAASPRTPSRVMTDTQLNLATPSTPSRRSQTLIPQGTDIIYLIESVTTTDTCILAVEIVRDDDSLPIATGSRASWMETPRGSPQVMELEIHNPTPPGPPPPAYYTIPLSADSFNFPRTVVDLLRAVDAGPSMLCKIAAAQDYDIESWTGQFVAAGLSETTSVTLQRLFLEALTPMQRDILYAVVPISYDIIPGSPTTSVGTESSIAYSSF